ncbi:MAG: ATP-dependent Clp protease proteolytic subunit [Tannerella sp.]|nr:ATP-dependent Clp protease proteolytic subunit [Tannerella sp.]
MDGFIKFYAPVTPNTAIQLQQLVEQLLRQGMNRLHLLLSTPGGSVHDGISIYNLLKAIPIEVNTYNFGSVDSIGVVIFCAGTNRYSVPHARFLLHPVSMQVLANQTFDEPLIAERLNALKSDQSNIAKVISATINQPVEHVLKLIHDRTSLEPEKALEHGLVTEIKSSLIPPGANLVSIYDNQVPQGMQIVPPGIFPLRGLSIPDPQNTSSITHSFSTIKSY